MAQKSETKQADHENASKQAPSPSVQPVETEENAGNSPKSLKKVLEHNVSGQGQRHPATPAGQHATGSFTGEESKDAEAQAEKTGHAARK